MKEKTKEIAARIKELREKLGINIQDVVSKTTINKYDYTDYESGMIDIPVSAVLQIANCFNVDISELLTGETPTNSGYSITRKGEGVSVERHSQYKYQALAHDFVNKKGSPFVLTIDASDEEVHYNHHKGQEFIYVLDGTIKIYFKDDVFSLKEGDSVYFDANIPHAVKTENGERAKVLAVVS
ncbi:MAG TPA: cupin domain-containing protein [Bacteroidales bacterium]|nr:MAG: DNA-binding transcriptional repressor PuuR [Bacteroidetes bacterium ADurb.Bin217]HOS84187.1 cupin domain-containing protein [Bacteroidales bacterium]HPH15941.1 cupin domain-containing protein [Bacteroidales bacterium]HPM13035.1 cupin domain-containing protein [Bacteroidales bacterium]